MKFNVGQIVMVSGFCYKNKEGGTGIADDTKATLRVTKEWNDDECGQRGIGEAMDTATHLFLVEHADLTDQRLFISEFDVIEVGAMSR